MNRSWRVDAINGGLAVNLRREWKVDLAREVKRADKEREQTK